MKLDIDDREKFIKQMDNYLNTRIIGSFVSVDDLKCEIKNSLRDKRDAYIEELESRVEKMADAYMDFRNKFLEGTCKAIDALDICNSKKARKILQRLLED